MSVESVRRHRSQHTLQTARMFCRTPRANPIFRIFHGPVDEPWKPFRSSRPNRKRRKKKITDSNARARCTRRLWTTPIRVYTCMCIHAFFFFSAIFVRKTASVRNIKQPVAAAAESVTTLTVSRKSPDWIRSTIAASNDASTDGTDRLQCWLRKFLPCPSPLWHKNTRVNTHSHTHTKSRHNRTRSKRDRTCTAAVWFLSVAIIVYTCRSNLYHLTTVHNQ